MNKQETKFTVFPTEMGWMGIVFTRAGIYASVLPQETETEARDKLLSRVELKTHFRPGFLGTLEKKLQSYFRGENMSVNYDVCHSPGIDWSWATPFQKRVLETVCKIPWGKSMTYGEVALRIGLPRGARAVGGALAANRIPIIIPCHRVIAYNGRLGGFTGAGTQVKARLLRMEGMDLGD